MEETERRKMSWKRGMAGRGGGERGGRWNGGKRKKKKERNGG